VVSSITRQAIVQQRWQDCLQTIMTFPEVHKLRRGQYPQNVNFYETF